MTKQNTLDSIARTARETRGLLLVALALLLLPAVARAEPKSGWSMNFTPVLLLPKDDYRIGGGVDPELKYTLDLGAARLSAGARVGAYYAKNLWGVTMMPTVRVTLPVGAFDPYLSFGVGYGWLPKTGHADIATMSRLGLVVHFSERFALGLEGTFQQLDRSAFRFPSVGSMLSLDL